MPKYGKLFPIALILGLLLIGGVLTVSAAELLHVPPAPNSPIQRYGERDKLCSVWTDGCVTCTREARSNIGIACQPNKISCTQSLRPN